MKYKIKIDRTIVIVLIIVTFFIIYLAYQSGSNPNYEFKTMTVAPDEYWNLFPSQTRKRMSVTQTSVLKFQNPQTEFLVDSRKYFIKVFKLDTKSDLSLKKFISISRNSDILNNGITYFEMDGLLFNLNIKTGKNTANYLSLNINGKNDSTLIRNDTIAYFYSNFKQFSINFDRSNSPVIWGITDGRPPKIPNVTYPIDIMFLRRHKAIYLLIMSVNDSNTSLSPSSLLNLIYK